MTEMEFSSAREIAAEIRAGTVSAREVTERMLARIAADQTVNGVVETRPEYAVRAATAADEAAWLSTPEESLA